MKQGNVNCSCGQSFWVESVANSVNCIRCAKEHDISAFPEKVETIEEQPTEVAFEELIDPPTEEGDGDGTNI